MNACCGMDELMAAPTKTGERCAQCGEALPDSVLSWIRETDERAWYFCTPHCHGHWQARREEANHESRKNLAAG